MDRCKTVDPRQPRVGQAITGTVLAVGFVAGWPVVLPILAAVLALASLVAYALARGAEDPAGRPIEAEAA